MVVLGPLTVERVSVDIFWSEGCTCVREPPWVWVGLCQILSFTPVPCGDEF